MKKYCLTLLKKSKNISIYLAGAVLIKGIHYLSTPIFTRVMTTTEYGAASIFTTWTTILSIFIAFQISGTIPSAYVRYGNKLRKYVSTALTLSLTTFFLFTASLFLLRGEVARYLQLPNIMMVPLLCVCAFGKSMSNLYSAYTIQLKQPKQNVLFSLVVSLIQLALGFAFVVLMNEKPLGKAMGESIGFFFTMVFVLCFFRISLGDNTKEVWKFTATMGGPLIVHLLSTNIISQSDRIFITEMLGYEAQAVYSVSATIGMISVVLVEALINVWTPWYFDRLQDEKDTDKIVQKYHDFAVIAITLFNILVVLFCPLLYKIMAPQEYKTGMMTCVIIVVSSQLNFFYRFPLAYEQYVGNLKWVGIATVLSASCNLILNYFLIKRWGIEGAAVATVISVLILWVVHELVVKKVVKGYKIRSVLNILSFSSLLVVVVIAKMLYADM